MAIDNFNKRMIVSELSDLNEAFGNNSSNPSIAGQLSDLAESAESGMIGGGPYIINAVLDEPKQKLTFDRTAKNVISAVKNERVVLLKSSRILASGETKVSMSMLQSIIYGYVAPYGNIYMFSFSKGFIPYAVALSLDGYLMVM